MDIFEDFKGFKYIWWEVHDKKRLKEEERVRKEKHYGKTLNAVNNSIWKAVFYASASIITSFIVALIITPPGPEISLPFNCLFKKFLPYIGTVFLMMSVIVNPDWQIRPVNGNTMGEITSRAIVNMFLWLGTTLVLVSLYPN